jgi:cytochrome b
MREPDTEVGHNAAGGWMVLMLLLLLAVQVGSGLCAHDRQHNAGPLAKYVGDAWGERLSLVHSVNFNIILAAIGLHVLAVASYAVFKRQNLLRPMLTGKKRLPAITRAPRMASPLLALLVLALAAAVAWAVATQT